MIKTKKQMFVIIASFVLVILLGTTTYAFFNYTRTSTANVIRTGRIAFNSTQGTAITLTDLFPIDVSQGIPEDNTKVGTLTINIIGDTEYTGGIEYSVTAVNVSNTVGNKQLPISINVSVTSNTGNNPATTLGTADDDYFTDRGGDTSYYKVLASDVIENNEELLVGYIAPGQNGVDGNIIIKAYLDADKIAISDTYYENATITPTPTAPNDMYGTTTEWVDGRVVLTTTEWNSLQTSGVSFQIKVEANEGTWIEGPSIPTIASCPGCKFMFAEETGNYSYGENGSTLEDIENNGDILVDDYTTLNSNHFLGFKIENDVITKAYACGIKGTDNNGNINQGTAFCLEGNSDGLTFTANKNLITGATLWNDPDLTAGRCVYPDNDGEILCDGSVMARVGSFYNFTQVYSYIGGDRHVCYAESDANCLYP